MDIIWLCLHCPGKFCELLPDALEIGEITVKALITQALKSLPLITIVDKVEIDFLHTKNIYTIQACIWYFDSCNVLPTDKDNIGVRIEGLVGQSLLQLFWEVSLDATTEIS
ncbi:MAG: hypothetical protein ACJ8BW_11630 [Ktedonobacteraceae bacterium]